MSTAPPDRDESLPLFERPTPGGEGPWPEPELAVAGAASSLPVRLDGAKATTLGTVRGTWNAIRFGLTRAVAALAWGDDVVANAVVSPGLIRRERVGRSRSWEETVLVAPALPLVVLTAGPGRGPATIGLTALPAATSVRYRTEGGAITVAGSRPDSMLALVALPGSCAWSVGSAPDGGALLRCSSDEGIASIVLAYGSEAAIRGALSGTRHLAGHARRAGARPDDELLALRTGVHRLDDALAWMERRLEAGIDSALAGALRTEPASALGSQSAGTGATGWLWAGLGAAAIGDPERARRCGARLEQLGRPDAAAFLQARAALSDGRTDGLLEAAERSLTATDVPDPALRRLGLRAAADALRYAATDTALQRLSAAGREIDPQEIGGRGGGSADEGAAGDAHTGEAGRVAPNDGPAAARSGVRLPTLGLRAGPASGGDPPVTPGTWLSYAFGSPRDRTAPEPPDGENQEHVTRALRAWGAMASPGDGWASWRAMVAEGLDSGKWGVGCWDPVDPESPPAATGILLAAMAFGWLGAFPDAPVGRLTLKPRIPERVTSFRFEGITVGDARVVVAYQREGSTHRFDLDPRRGRVPPLVVFETTVPGAAARVTIDGAPAELDATPSGAGVTVRLQTPLDATRRIEITVG